MMVREPNRLNKFIKAASTPFGLEPPDLAAAAGLAADMGSIFLPHLRTGWHVDQAILSEQDKLVVIRFGSDTNVEVAQMDEVLYGIADQVRNFVSIYVCDNTEVTDFNEMYELYDDLTVMFFWRNKHMMCDFGTGDNNKLTWVIEDPQAMIDILEVIFRGARRGKGLVVSPIDYSHER